MSYGRGTYEGVYIIYLRKGNMEKSHLGTTSKLQCPKLFMKSIYEIEPAKATMEFVSVKIIVSNGIANSRKYPICSANGWITTATQYKLINERNAKLLYWRVIFIEKLNKRDNVQLNE